MKRMILGGLLLLGACSTDSHTAPTAGTVMVKLTAGGGNDGALVITVAGGPVTAVTATSGYEVISNTDATGTHLIVTGNIGTGAVATLSVPDMSKVSTYSASVDQAADRTTFALLDPAPYRVTVQ